MNKLKNKLFVVFTLIITLLSSLGITNVNAASAPDGMPQSVTIESNKEVSFIFGEMKNGHIAAYLKKTEKGYVYCIEPNKGSLGKETLTYAGELTDPGYLYLAKNGFPNKKVISEYGDEENYYVTQIAHWIYAYVVYGLKDDDKIVGYVIDKDGNKSYHFYGGSNETYKQTKLADAAYELYSKAKKAHDAGTTSTALKVSAKVASKKLVKNDNTLLSKPVSVTVTGAKTYTVSVNKGTVVDENGNAKKTFNANEKFMVKTTYSDSVDITATITVDSTEEKVYRYAPSSASKQDTLYSVVKSVPISAKTTVKFEYSVDETLISKVDATTGKELPGAHLEIKDSNGEVVESWISTSEVHKVKLAPGTYTLSETLQPDGYILSTETVTFTVKEDGTSDKVVMKNAPIGDTLISKVDATTGSELPGAHLEIKDSNGEVVESWISTSEVHKVKLAPGTYTLSETLQPDGYILSTETVTFTVKEDGTSDKVVMKNAPIGDTLISKVDATTGSELPGAHLEIRDSEENLVEAWTSTENVHKVKLAPGTYTLSETIAPEGYILSTEKITFTVKEDGTSDKVVMKNAPIKEPIEISKVDASNGNELPGAHLELKDNEGNLVEAWTSTNETHKIVLEDGIYTLSETIAPEGYELTTETISFEVVNGKVANPIVMKNHPYHDVPITSLNASTSSIILGSLFVLLGTSIVVLKLRKEY